MDDVPIVATIVRVVGSRTHAGKTGQVLRYTPEMAVLQLDDGNTIKVKKKNIEPTEQHGTNQSTCNHGVHARSSAEVSARAPCDNTGLLPHSDDREDKADFLSCDGSSTSTVSGDNPSEPDTASVTSSGSLGVLNLAATTASAAGTVAQMTFGGLAWGGRAIAHIVLGRREEPTYF